MGRNKLPLIATLLGLLLIAVGVGAYDWRAGVIVAGVLCAGMGVLFIDFDTPEGEE